MNDSKKYFKRPDPKEYFKRTPPREFFYRNLKDLLIGHDATTGKPAYLNLDLFKTHLHVLGRTSKGKTRFLALLAQDLLKLGIGGCVIDIQGGLYHLIENYVAQRPEFQDRVIFLNPGEAQDPVVAFNPLMPTNYVEPQGRVDMMIEAMKKHMKQAEQTMPTFEYIASKILPVLIDGGLTILEGKYFKDWSDTTERDWMLRHISDPQIQREWRTFDDQSNRDKKSDILAFRNRIDRFDGFEMLRYTLGRTNRLLDLEDIFNSGKLLLVNLRYPTKLSFDAATLIGICLIQELFYYAMSRHEDEAKKHPFVLMIDEMQNFITPDIIRILDQCRQKGLHLVLAHQRLHQLMTQDEDLFSAVMDNALTKVIFGVSFRDAEILANEIFKLDPDRVKLELYRTAVLDYELEYHTTRSSGSSADTATSRQDQYQRGAFGFGNELLDSYSITESERRGITESSSQQIIQRPVFGEELSNVIYYPLDEQKYMAATQLKEQPVAHAYVKRLEEQPHQVRILTVPDWPRDEKLLKQAYSKSQKANQCYLSKAETRRAIEKRQQRIEQGEIEEIKTTKLPQKPSLKPSSRLK